MHRRKIERNAFIWLACSFTVFAVCVALAPGLRTAFKWLGPLFAFATTLVWAYLWRDRRRARVPAELRTPPAMPGTTVRYAGVGL